MQKWEYIQVWVHWNKDSAKRDYFVRYITVDGEKIEYPPNKEEKNLLGKLVQTKPSDQESMDWLYRKIAELGREGWEMVSSPNSETTGTDPGGSWTYMWLLWFKRPIP